MLKKKCKEHSIRDVNETRVCLLKRSKRRDDDGMRMKNEMEVNGSKYEPDYVR